MGTAWARHAMCESAFTVPQKYTYTTLYQQVSSTFIFRPIYIFKHYKFGL